VTVGAVGVATVVVVVVVVVVEVGATVVVVVEPAAPPPDALVERTAKHTVSPMNNGVESEAELRRNNRACGTLKRAANRVHESFGNTRCVEVHCGEGFTLDAAVEVEGATTSDETTSASGIRARNLLPRCVNIPLM
jgi:hypothetical protein